MSEQEYVTRDCPMCKGEGAYNFKRIDPETHYVREGREICILCRGAGKVKLPILEIEWTKE